LAWGAIEDRIDSGHIRAAKAPKRPIANRPQVTNLPHFGS
jgi:hypothetical protein